MGGNPINAAQRNWRGTENFWNKAIQISVGSLSPTINWKSIADVVFEIPNKNVQKKILEIILKIETFVNDQEIIPGSRGGLKNNIPIHAIRIPGIVANQDVIFGGQGQSLTIRQDTISRDAFMPGLLLAIRATSSHTGLIYGLENLLD